MTEQEIKLKCLEIAAKSPYNNSPELIIAEATKYYNYLTQKQPSVSIPMVLNVIVSPSFGDNSNK